MKFELNLNGKTINMTPFILQQMAGEITRQDVQDRIDFYLRTSIA